MLDDFLLIADEMARDDRVATRHTLGIGASQKQEHALVHDGGKIVLRRWSL